MAREPRASADVAKQVARFAGFADDQYLDVVALFAALSTRLRRTGSGFVKIYDDSAQHFLDNVLEYGPGGAMSSGISHRKDVEFLEDCNPPLVERNADEFNNGKANEQSLAELIHTKSTAITREAHKAEPMRQWEDMRDTTGVMDCFAVLTMDVDDIRDDANRLHDAAGGDFHLAKITEQKAREICVHELKQAYDLPRDFRMGFIQRVDVVSAIAELRREAAEASAGR
ncbi:hypothetical protein ACH4LS_00080 [Streptomyces luteogriseus]|uniref:hypothetical protein n=1 Tax=Streptomyces luteogriseus TaxID=68233 RepID=UPI00379DEB23